MAVPLLLGFLLFGDQIEEALGSADGLAVLRERGELAGWFGVALLASDLLLPIPSSGVMAVLGELLGPWRGGAYAALGSVGGGLLGYALVRLLGARAARWFAGEEQIEQLRGFFETRGVWAIALTRVLPLVPEVLVCLAGLAGMGLLRFVVALTAGAVPLAFALAWFGAVGADRPVLTALIAMVVPVLLLPLGLAWVRRAGLRREGVRRAAP